jgi:hypothetical protein
MGKRKKFGIVCKTKKNFEKIKNGYWQYEMGDLLQYEFVWIKPEDLGITGNDISILFFDESHEFEESE